MNLDDIDAHRGGPFRVHVDGHEVVLPPATALPWKDVVAAVSSPHYFIVLVWPITERVEAWKIEALQQAWVRHQGLPPAEQIRRLVQMMEKYGDAINYDLQHHLSVSAKQMWRDRQWSDLLNFIDHLPTNSHKHQLLTSDEEYMEATMKAAKGRQGSGRPAMSDWALENSQLATLIDAVNRNSAATLSAAGVKGNSLKWDPQPRPASVVEKVQYRLDKAAHEDMNAKLLGSR